jgi:cytochrome c
MIKALKYACHLMATAGAMAISQPALAQDTGHGKVVFEQCAACHSLEAGHNETGPSLKGIIGRKSASVDDFIYSPAMRRANVTWTPEQLDAYLKDPQAPPFRGNRMPFAGIPDAQARADLIAYIQQASR